MAGYKSDLVDLTLTFLTQSERAILVTPDGKIEAWLPKSMIEVEPNPDSLKRGDTIFVTVPQWKAKEAELV